MGAVRVAEDIYELYEKEERMAAILGKIDIASRMFLGIIYVLMISEITGIPVVVIFEYISRVARLMPAILAPFRTEILLTMLFLDTVDIMFGNLLVRAGKRGYITAVMTVGAIFGFLTFCAFPSFLVFMVFFVPKVLALYVLMNHPESIRAMVHFYETGSFE